MNTDKNPLLDCFNTPYNTPPFDQIEIKHYEPAFEQAIADARKEIEAIATAEKKADFENTIAALDAAGEKLDEISSVFFNLNSACTSIQMQEIAQHISPKLTQYGNDIYMNRQLFQRVRQVYEGTDRTKLTPEQQTLLDKTWRTFVKGGANLEGEVKKRFQEIAIELSGLGLKFDENMLAETNAYELYITDKAELQGLPDSLLDTAAQAAKEKRKEGWMFTLHAPSYIPFMKYADNRELRERFYRAYTSRCNKDNINNNNAIIQKIVNLRYEKANILGYHNYAEFVLADRMAKKPAAVTSFLSQLLEASHPFALKEQKEVADFARKTGLTDELQRWDWAYYSNKLKQEKYALDDEMLRPYFKLENIQKGVFGLATTLYGIYFKEVGNIPKYHEDVKTFEVYDEDGSFLAILYTDFFPRASKGGGAWMTEYRTQRKKEGKEVRPIVSIVMNFTKPTECKPSLLTFDEVTTFLHEFGHALHGMLSNNTYNSTAGTNVYRDFVELPSQLMENWALEKEWLDQWAIHYQTNEPIPQEYVTKIKNTANFQSGYQSDRQLSFGMVDMAWHTLSGKTPEDVPAFEQQAMGKTEIFPPIEGSCFSSAFSHIFGGGYAAGYYSYKWAEVLDADAFSLFRQKGIFNRATATSFRKNILERGGSEHPMILYTRFRGQEPDINALLERSGLKSEQ